MVWLDASQTRSCWSTVSVSFLGIGDVDCLFQSSSFIARYCRLVLSRLQKRASGTQIRANSASWTAIGAYHPFIQVRNRSSFPPLSSLETLLHRVKIHSLCKSHFWIGMQTHTANLAWFIQVWWSLDGAVGILDLLGSTLPTSGRSWKMKSSLAASRWIPNSLHLLCVFFHTVASPPSLLATCGRLFAMFTPHTHTPPDLSTFQSRYLLT